MNSRITSWISKRIGEPCSSVRSHTEFASSVKCNTPAGVTVVVIEDKTASKDPYTHTYVTDRKEVTVDWKIWRAMEASSLPVRLVIVHGEGIWMHRSPDMRENPPHSDRLGGKGGRAKLAWWRWNDFHDPVAVEGDPSPKAPEPEMDIMTMLNGAADGDEAAE